MMERRAALLRGLGGKRGEKGKKRIVQEGNNGREGQHLPGALGGKKEMKRRGEE